MTNEIAPLTVNALIAQLQRLADLGYGDLPVWQTGICAYDVQPARYRPRLDAVRLPIKGRGNPKWADTVRYMSRPENFGPPEVVVRL